MDLEYIIERTEKPFRAVLKRFETGENDLNDTITELQIIIESRFK